MDVSPDKFIAAVQSAIQSEDDFLSELGPMVMAAAALGLASDSRSFARCFEVSHAFVLRECIDLQASLGFLTLDDGKSPSGRVFFALTEKGRKALEVGR